MSRFIRFYSIVILLLVLVMACQSSTEPAAARPGFTDKPGTLGSINLSYVDTNTAEWKDIIGKLDNYYAQQVRYGFNGSVLIGYKGQVLYERYYGYANKEAKLPLKPNSAVQLASISKTFTGACILYLYQQKYLDIDSPVAHYLPNFPYKHITVRMCLNHRSGMPDYTHWVSVYRKDTKTPIYNDDVLALMAKYQPKLVYRSDTRFKYSNTNYIVLASVLEKVTGMKYKDFMKRYVFEPLGMKNTFVYDPADGFPENATVSYKYNWLRYPQMFADGVYGDKGIYSTVEDMYRWDQSFYHNRLLSNETMELAYGPCSPDMPGVKNYGLGWRMLCYPSGYKIIYHNGWWHGNNTCFYRFIQDNFTIIILGNKYNKNIYHQPPILYGILKNTEVEDFDEEG